LVITLTLLALLMLTLVGLSAFVKVNGQVAASTAAQSLARQNALLALSIARSDLQRYAGGDEQITGMAGVSGVAALASSTTRNWCGVWRNDGSFVRWLTSGAQLDDSATLEAGVTSVVLAGSGVNGGAGTVGASAAHSEHVIAGRIPIVVSEIAGAPGTASTIGRYAFLVSDEGVKISSYSPPAQLLIAGVTPLITSTAFGSAQEKLRSAVESYAATLPTLISYEQLSVLPTPSPALTQSVLQDNFHHVTLTALTVSGGQLRSGAINLNTSSPYVWRSILETYNAVPAVTPFAAAELSLYGAALANAFASSASGKSAGGPFTTVSAFGASSLLSDNLPATITPEDFMAAVGGILAVRSDTFRIRAYGEALDPFDETVVEASAYCEAIVQRTPEAAPNGLGRRFVVLNFRWLSPDDI
jgi:hypothetical protein